MRTLGDKAKRVMRLVFTSLQLKKGRFLEKMNSFPAMNASGQGHKAGLWARHSEFWLLDFCF
jgi:hypothetical protein